MSVRYFSNLNIPRGRFRTNDEKIAKILFFGAVLGLCATSFASEKPSLRFYEISAPENLGAISRERARATTSGENGTLSMYLARAEGGYIVF